jgi:hypothetical protein
MAALRLVTSNKEGNESIYKLCHEGPTVLVVSEIRENARRLGIDSDNERACWY